MQDNLISLSRLFTQRIFRIPDYQRGYSWEERHVRDFWHDLQMLDSDSSHYTGLLTLEPVPESIYDRWVDDIWIIKSKSYEPYHIVDGQQRLTTALILLQVLLERSEGHDLNYSTHEEIVKKYVFETKDGGISHSYIFGYDSDTASDEYLRAHIFQSHSDRHSSDERSLYTHNLKRAKELFLDSTDGMTVEKLEILFTKLTQKLIFNTHILTSDVDTFVAFETMNNRGKDLSSLELLKNRLIYLTTRLGDSASEKDRARRIVSESWKTVYHLLGKNRKRPLPDDLFLSRYTVQHLVDELDLKEEPFVVRLLLRESRISPRRNAKRTLLDDIFTARNLPGHPDPVKGRPEISVAMVKDFAAGLKDYASLYYRLYNPEGCDQYSDEVTAYLTRLRRLDYLKSMPLISAVARATNERRYFLKFLRHLEALSFAGYVWRDARHPSREEDSFESLAVMVERGDLKPSALCTRLADRCRRVVTSKKFDYIIWANISKRFYGWRVLRYFLYEYEMELKRASRSGLTKLDWDEFVSPGFEDSLASVEHIMPQKATGSYWKQALEGVARGERRKLRHSLGNLVAVSRARNSAFGNRSFDEKKSGTENVKGYRYGSYQEIEVSEYEAWGPEEILDRGVRMLEFMEQHWGFDLGSRKDKVKLLGLEFMA